MADKEGKILVIDDDPDILITAKMILKKHYRDVEVWDGPGRLEQGTDISDKEMILLDMNFSPGATSGEEGLYWLKSILQNHPDVVVIMITAYGDIDLAVKAMKLGAVDFIVKPWENQKFLATVQSGYQLSKSRKQVSHLQFTQKILEQDLNEHYRKMTGSSEAMNEIYQAIDKVAATDVNVLILGENGTGKELVARELHRKSPRASKIFMGVDMGSLSESLFESELFGHVKGAFTDAKESRMGRFEMADGGSLFLDEIGNLSMALQSKLLTVIQRKEVVRVGSANPVPVDVRLICASNMPLREMVTNDRFRQDLFYRINTVEINVPPLRERVEDIPDLTHYYLKQYGRKYRKPNLTIDKPGLEKLKKYQWPGNVRELQHVIERTVIMTDNRTIKKNDLILDQKQMSHVDSRNLNLEELEKRTIEKALKKHNNNLTAAAKELGLGRTTLYRKMTKYEL